MPLPGADSFNIEILDDGSIVVSTPGEVSTANHMSADEFNKFIQREMGGKVTKSKLARTQEQAHGHTHLHQGH